MKIIRSRFLAAILSGTAAALMPHASFADAPRHTLLVNEIGPAGSELFVANPDGSGEHPLITDWKMEYDATYSNDGQWVVFTSERDGPANLYRVHPDGSGLERLTNHPGFDDQAAASPHGWKIAFVSTRDGGVPNIWTLDLKTHALRNLTGGIPVMPDQRHSFLRPAWSPDGHWIAFSSDLNTPFEAHKFPSPGWEHIQRSSVYIIRPNGTGLRRISDGTEYAGSPKWSPDGKQVVFYSMAADQTFAARINGLEPKLVPAPTDSQLVSVDITTGEREMRSSGPGLKVSPQFLGPDLIGYVLKGTTRGELAYTSQVQMSNNAPQNIGNPSWSPDGQYVVYQKYSYGLHQNDPIYTPDPDFAMRFSGEFPAISAKGQVALTSFVHDEKSVAAVAMGTAKMSVPLRLTDLNGGPITKIYERPGVSVISPSWSPDGGKLVVTQGTMQLNTPSQLLVVNADSSNPRLLTDDRAVSSSFPSWSPDGDHIVYRVRGPGEEGLRIIDLKDGSVKKLTSQHDTFPFFSPNGQQICFTRDTGGSKSFDIFTIHPDGSGLTRLTDAPGNDAHCTWSADGSFILFSSARLGFRDEAGLYNTGSAQPYAELFIMRADGSGQRPITDDKWEQGTPAWFPEK